MISIRLNYPYHQDLRSFEVPLPQTAELRDACLLLFKDTGDYYRYLNQLCDLVDEMEFSRLASYSRPKAEKLRFCKQYLEHLAGAVHC
jgi:hypothetical protein